MGASNSGWQRPQGARLIGSYDSQVALGQLRALLVWTGSLCRMDAPSCSRDSRELTPWGTSGLEDEIDNHWKELLGAAALSTLLGWHRSELWHGCEQYQHRDHSGITTWGRGFSQSDGPAGGPAQSQHPADADHSSGTSGEGDRQPRPYTGAL